MKVWQSWGLIQSRGLQPCCILWTCYVQCSRHRLVGIWLPVQTPALQTLWCSEYSPIDENHQDLPHNAWWDGLFRKVIDRMLGLDPLCCGASRMRTGQGICVLRQGILGYFRPLLDAFGAKGLFKDTFLFEGRGCIPLPSKCAPALNFFVWLTTK